MSLLSSKTSHFLELLMEMTARELNARYKNTIFGFVWALVNPCLQMVVISFVFRFIVKEPLPNYNLYLLSGLLVWNFFSSTQSKAVSSIVNERFLVKKANFPKEVIPLSIVLSGLLHLMASFFVFILLLLFLGLLSSSFLPQIVLGCLILLATSTGLALLTSALNVVYRDVSFFVQALLLIWFYVTPVVYALNSIPEKVVWLWKLNPLTFVLQSFQSIISSFYTFDQNLIIGNGALALLILFSGIVVFRNKSKTFDDWL